MKISVAGAGYVGLVTGICLASSGIDVLCCDADESRTEALKNGVLPIYEPKLGELLNRCHSGEKRIGFTSDMEQTVNHAEVIFITVNTPTSENNLSDLSNVFDVARKIGKYMNSPKVIVNKSTAPVGTGRKILSEIANILRERSSSLEFDVVSNPEFLREGSAVDDFTNPERIVLGADSPKAADTVKAVYAEQAGRNIPVLVTGIETAEMIKYASNAFLAARVSFINEIANICELCGADAAVVAEGMGLDSRIGPKFLKPGPGFGGSCFPKDLRALSGLAVSLGYAPFLLDGVLKTNKRQTAVMLNKIRRSLAGTESRTVTVLGVSFKPDTDDIRDAPSIPIIEGLLKDGITVRLYDPKAMDNLKRQYPHLAGACCQDTYSACERSDCIVLVTEWQELCSLDFKRLEGLVSRKVFLDLRNAYDPGYVRSCGFYYEGVGRI